MSHFVPTFALQYLHTRYTETSSNVKLPALGKLAIISQLLYCGYLVQIISISKLRIPQFLAISINKLLDIIY